MDKFLSPFKSLENAPRYTELYQIVKNGREIVGEFTQEPLANRIADALNVFHRCSDYKVVTLKEL